MKITLERPELIHILSRSLGYYIEDDDVTIQPDPFEISISNVSLTANSALTEPVNSVPLVEEKEEEEEEESPNETLTMEDLLSKNAAYGGPKIAQTQVKDSTPLTRRLGPLETENPPPITQEEIHAVLRGQSR